MHGFDDKALILFPRLENYINRSVSYKMQFATALNKLMKYLDINGIAPHVFYTDDVARNLNKEEFQWVSTLARGDLFFISKHCEGCADALTKCSVLFENVYNEILTKDPGEINMSETDRFEMVIRHINKAANRIIPMYKIVVHFSLANKSQYKVTSKPGDGKIRIVVNANNFSPKVYMGGKMEDACDILDANYANRSLDRWEV